MGDQFWDAHMLVLSWSGRNPFIGTLETGPLTFNCSLSEPMTKLQLPPASTVVVG